MRNRWIAALVLLAVTGGIWWSRRRSPVYSSAYISDRAATLWSTTAQVRQPVATLHYGERVDVLRRSGDQVEVRPAGGASGWIDARLLMDPALWQQSAQLLGRVRSMPVQALAHTRSVSNVHIEPGRDAPRIFQFGRNVPVAVFGRKLVSAPRSSEAASEGDNAPPAGEGAPAKDEDWLLVVRREEGSAVSGGDAASNAPIAGWVLGQFVALDPPAPIPDYANAAGVNVVAWAMLGSAADPAGDKPQYLVAVARGGQDRACDFTGLRVYTWGVKRQRYETAYVENDLCGRMPIRVQKSPEGAEFSFPAVGENRPERVYRLKQTIVRRLRNEGVQPEKR